jgi:hypothetical protein
MAATTNREAKVKTQMLTTGNRSHTYRLLSVFPLIVLMVSVLFVLSGCNSSDVNKQDSVSSGTSTGFGSGDPVSQVTVTAGSSQIFSGGSSSLTVITTDNQGRRSDAFVILSSSGGGTFVTSTGSTAGGILTTTYTAPTITSPIDTEITATVVGTNIKGSTIISITPAS